VFDRPPKHGHTGIWLIIRSCPCLHQKFRQSLMAVVNGGHKRSPFTCANHIDVCPALTQKQNDIRVTLTGRPIKSRPAIRRSTVRHRATNKQKAHRFQVTVASRVHQRRPTILSACVGVGSVEQSTPAPSAVARTRGVVQHFVCHSAHLYTSSAKRALPNQPYQFRPTAESTDRERPRHISKLQRDEV
jgi:hypothetical protein